MELCQGIGRYIYAKLRLENIEKIKLSMYKKEPLCTIYVDSAYLW